MGDIDQDTLNSIARAIMDGGMQGIYTALGLAYSIAKAGSTQPRDPTGVADVLRALAQVPPKPPDSPGSWFAFGFYNRLQKIRAMSLQQTS